MKKNKLRRAISYIFADDENLVLENRILLSATIIGILITIFAAIVNSILTTSIISVIVPLIIAVLLLIFYYFIRFKSISQTITISLVSIGIIGSSAVWIFNGGINGGNMMPAFVVLILGLLVVSDKVKKYIIALFLVSNIFSMLIQFFWPEIIVPFPTETDRWIDTMISLVYSSYFIYLIIRFFHKNYKIEKDKAEENEKKFRILYDSSPDMYLSVSAPDATILMCNRTLLDNLGYTRDEVIGKQVFTFNFYENKEQDRINFDQFLETGIVRNRDLIIKKKDGSRMEVSLNADAVRDENQNILYSISSWRDITEQKKAEQIIIEQNNELSKLNADKDRFMSILAHDLKSPFNSLLGLSDLLLLNLPKYDTERIEQQLTVINKVSHQTYNLLEDLLLWSKSQSGKLPFEPQNIDFKEICYEIINDLTFQAVTKKILLKFFESEKTVLYADYNMMKTILRNLISNAIKFTNEQGQIDVFSIKENSNILITVSDNGVGIEKENQDKLWDLTQHFSGTGTAGEKGTGLGLLLCKEFVEKHGGKIWVESRIGQGSNFKLTIPLL